MRLHVLIGQRRPVRNTVPQPEALVCCDDDSHRADPRGFETDCAEARIETRDEFASFGVITVDVDPTEIARSLTPRAA